MKTKSGTVSARQPENLPWKLCRVEKGLLLLFLAVLPFGIFYLKLTPSEMLVGWAFYLVVEMLSEKAWIYSDAIRSSPFTLNGHDVSQVVPFGWLSILISGLAFGHFMDLHFKNISSYPEPFWSSLGIFLSGIALEYTLVRFKMFTYNDEHWMVRFGFARPIRIWKLPLTVWGGYALTGLLWSTLYRLSR